VEFYKDFIELKAYPYFRDLFFDLSKREKDGEVLLKSTWLQVSFPSSFQYCSLSGLLSDRIYQLMYEEGEEGINLKNFVKVLAKIFLSDLATK